MATGVPPPSHAVLVVEDVPLLRMMAVDMIEEAGFQAVEAADSEEAIAILESRLDIRVVFTDIDMPGSMDGLMLAKLIRERWPPIEIIVTSGKRWAHEMQLPERALFFPKPYQRKEIVAAIERMAAAAGA